MIDAAVVAAAVIAIADDILQTPTDDDVFAVVAALFLIKLVNLI
jgi:hypothetical protein